MKLSSVFFAAGLVLLFSCGTRSDGYDASGYFEADEVIVSAQQSGQLLSFAVNEGEFLPAGNLVGQIDVTLPMLQMEQAKANITALQSRTSSAADQNELVKKQLAVQEAQLGYQIKERSRTENLVKADAATRKQLDDINALIDQLEKQISVTRQQLKVNSFNTQVLNNTVLSEKKPLEKSVAQYKELVGRGQIINPVSGIVLAKYALAGEMAITGKPLYRIASLDTLFLRAYLSGDQLTQIKIGQEVGVRIDSAKTGYKKYSGLITWIASQSEFTPKTIQTKNERSNLVYAIKIRVRNDGFIKIGMYGEMKLNPEMK
jgi:HlyD family secretion protein